MSGDVGGSCNTHDIGAGLADCEVNSSCDTDSGVQPVHIGRLHTDDAGCKPMPKVFLSKPAGGEPKLVPMSPSQPMISRIAADVLTGYYKRKRLTQEELAERSGMPITSVQKKLRAKAPITATDLVVLSRAIGLDPVEVMAEIMKETQHHERLASEGIPTIAEQTRKKRPSEMTEEELDAFDGETAANTHPDLGHDEPEHP